MRKETGEHIVVKVCEMYLCRVHVCTLHWQNILLLYSIKENVANIKKETVCGTQSTTCSVRSIE